MWSRRFVGQFDFAARIMHCCALTHHPATSAHPANRRFVGATCADDSSVLNQLPTLFHVPGVPAVLQMNRLPAESRTIVPWLHVPVAGAPGTERGRRRRPRVLPPLTSTS